jgi:hypothetical protein
MEGCCGQTRGKGWLITERMAAVESCVEGMLTIESGLLPWTDAYKEG